MPTIGAFRGLPPIDPKKLASPYVKMPPSVASVQYPPPSGVLDMPTIGAFRPTSVSKPTRTCVRYATKCLSPGRMVVDKNPMIPNERHLSGDQSSEEEAQGGAGRT